MGQTLTIRPARLRQFGPSRDCGFVVVTTPTMAKNIEIDATGAEYDSAIVITLGDSERFEEALASRIPDDSHVLAVCPDVFFESPSDELLGPRRKLLAMACNSTPTSPEVIQHFYEIMERTSSQAQDAFSDTFFELLEESEELVYADAKRGTMATLQHLQDGLVWNQQAGSVDWGEQQIVPSGEISVLPVEITEFSSSLHLPLAGDIVFRGYPILHNGTPSFTREDQARIHGELACLNHSAVIAHVEDGIITRIQPENDGARPAARMLEAMFSVDSRYQIVWEMGHALNTSLDLLPGNHAMNEVYGGTDGCLHWGLGLTPYTQYHLDIISPDTTVSTSRGTIVLGVEGGYQEDRLASPAAS
ncbi:MAG: hypothetical protein JO345_18135 [Streptosporangiaceae bacterium]|nr:hypothetical protein [Streptosporangiaceae bacterium]